MSEPATIRLRPIVADDEVTLFRLYASTRIEELAPTGWSDQQKASFLEQQFRAQSSHYRSVYADAAFDMIELEGAPIGRLYVHRGASETCVVDIALFPEHRGRGIATRLLQAVVDESDARRVTTSIHVERHNPAKHLYERLGFVVTGDTGVYFAMERAAR